MRKLGALALVLVVLALSVAAVFAAPPAGPGDAPGWRDGMARRGDFGPRGFGGFAGLGWLFALTRLIIPIGLIWLGYLAITRLVRPREDQALATLRERFARGEITDEQYQAMRRVLG